MMLKIISFLFEKLVDNLEVSKNKTERITRYLKGFTQGILLLFYFCKFINLNILDVESFKALTIIDGYFQQIVNRLNLEFFFFVYICSLFISFILSYSEKQIGGYIDRLFLQISVLVYSIRDCMACIFWSLFLFYILHVFFIELQITNQEYSFILTIYWWKTLFDFLMVFYHNNLKRLDEKRNLEYRESNWSGYVDIEDNKICLFDKVIYKNEEYTIYKLSEMDAVNWYLCKRSTPSNKQKYIKYPLEKKINHIKLYKPYSHFHNGIITDKGISNYIDLKQIILVSSKNEIEKVLSFYSNSEKLISIACIFLPDVDGNKPDILLKLEQRLLSYEQAMSAEVIVDKDEFISFAHNHSSYEVYSNRPISISGIDIKNIEIDGKQNKKYIQEVWEPFVKRLMDIIISTMVLVLFFPLILIIALLISLSDPGPIVFHFQRVGANGRIIKYYKFRTMRSDADRRVPIPRTLEELRMYNDSRFTPIGKVLRKLGLDMFPLFFNVLKGEMSIVGPTPYTYDEFMCMQDNHKIRYSVKPGMTGPSVMISQRIIDFEERIKLDEEYIKNWSVWKDIRILFKTVAILFTRR